MPYVQGTFLCRQINFHSNLLYIDVNENDCVETNIYLAVLNFQVTNSLSNTAFLEKPGKHHQCFCLFAKRVVCTRMKVKGEVDIKSYLKVSRRGI